MSIRLFLYEMGRQIFEGLQRGLKKVNRILQRLSKIEKITIKERGGMLLRDMVTICHLSGQELVFCPNWSSPCGGFCNREWHF